MSNIVKIQFHGDELPPASYPATDARTLTLLKEWWGEFSETASHQHLADLVQHLFDVADASCARADKSDSLLRPYMVASLTTAEAACQRHGTSKVYFVRSGKGPIKIGVTQSIAQRLQSLQNGSANRLKLLLTIEGDEAMERSIHERFAHLRIGGEWFRPARELLEHIKKLKTDRTTRELPPETVH